MSIFIELFYTDDIQMFYSNVNNFKEVAGYTIDGVWYPRVTKILEIKAKPALYFYYGEAESYKAAQDATKKSAEEGTLIHETVEKLFVGEKPDIPPSIAPAVHETIKFLENNDIQIDKENVERRIVHKDERYAGTIDTLALIDGKFGVLDIKTSQAIYRDYNLQTAAYMGQLTKEFKSLETRWILRIDQQKTCLVCGAMLRTKGGKDKIKAKNISASKVCEAGEHEWSDLKGIVEMKEFPYWKNDYEAFLSAKKLWEWENEYMLKQAGYLS